MGTEIDGSLFPVFQLSSSSLAFTAGVVEAYPKVFSIEEFPVEAGDRGPGLMPLHFNETEAPAFTGKNIRCQFDGADSAVFTK